MNIIRLGSINTDKATGLTGTLTHFCVLLGNRQLYSFQPRGLNPETGQPVQSHWIPVERLSCADDLEEVELPLEVLNTRVKDTASGFEGTAIGLILHINGCVHFDVQPAGYLSKTGAAFDTCNFDIRRLEGPALKKMTAEEVSADQKARPSPSPVGSYMPKRPL